MIVKLVIQLLQNQYRLTSREIEILDLILTGCISSNKLSKNLNISESTVNKYIESLSLKLGFKSRSLLLASILQSITSTLTPAWYSDPAHSQPKVAIVEDDSDISEHLSRLLQERGFDAIVIKNFENPIGEIAGAGFDVILCDLILPDQDGIKLSRSLTQNQPNGPSIILMTGFPELIDKFVNDSTKGIIATVLFKPIDPDELIRIVLAATVIFRMRNFLADAG